MSFSNNFVANFPLISQFFIQYSLGNLGVALATLVTPLATPLTRPRMHSNFWLGCCEVGSRVLRAGNDYITVWAAVFLEESVLWSILFPTFHIDGTYAQ